MQTFCTLWLLSFVRGVEMIYGVTWVAPFTRDSEWLIATDRCSLCVHVSLALHNVHRSRLLLQKPKPTLLLPRNIWGLYLANTDKHFFIKVIQFKESYPVKTKFNFNRTHCTIKTVKATAFNTQRIPQSAVLFIVLSSYLFLSNFNLV